MMLTASEHTRFVWVPAVDIIGTPSIFQRLFDCGPDASQPRIIAGDLPIAIGLHHAPELAIATGAEGPRIGPNRQLNAERHGPIVEQIVFVVGNAHGAFQRREEEGQRLLIVPDMGAASFATPFVQVQTFPAIEGAIFQMLSASVNCYLASPPVFVRLPVWVQVLGMLGLKLWHQLMHQLV